MIDGSDQVRMFAEAVNRTVRVFGGGSSVSFRDRVNELRAQFQFGEDSPTNVYSTSRLAFIQRYLLPNFLKCRYILHTLDKKGLLRSCQRILDIGSGPGTLAFAWMAHAAYLPPRRRFRQKLFLVDGVAEFFEIFEAVRSFLPRQRFNVALDVEFLKSVVAGPILQYCPNPDLIVLSNSSVELLRNRAVDQTSFLNDLNASKSIIAIIDYPYKSTSSHLLDLSEALSESHIPLDSDTQFDGQCSCFRHEMLDDFRRPFYGDLSALDLAHPTANFVVSIWVPCAGIGSPQNTSQNSLIEKYGLAWEQHDTSLLRRIFTRDAVYRERPDRKPFEGIEGICRYWRENAAKQKAVRFVVKTSRMEGNRLVAGWECSFFRKDLDRQMFLNGTLHAKVRGDRIWDFSEQFTKHFHDE